MTTRLDRLPLCSLVLALAGCPGDDGGRDDAGASASSSGTGDDTVGTMTSATVTMTGIDTGPADSSTDDTVTGPDPDSSSGSAGESGTDTTGGDSSSGEALEPEIEVTIAATAVDSGDNFNLLGTLDVGVVGTPVTVTIDNVGTGDLAIGGVTATDGDTAHFTINDAMLDATVMAGGSTTFTIAFSPLDGGIKGATFSIDNDDDDEAPFSFTLRSHTTPNTYRNVAPTTQPSARFNASMVDLQDGRLLLFGGRNALNNRLNDTWTYDVEANDWTAVVGGTPPGARDATAMAFVGGDTVILHGGAATGAGTALGETWAFDLVANTWSQLFPGGAPAARLQHAMVYVGDDTIVMFGGRTGGGGTEVGDTWAYDVVANTWTNLAPSGVPTPASSFALGYDGTGTITMFGGFNNTNSLDVTWGYDVLANTWTQGSPSSTPGARAVLLGDYYAGGAFIVHSGKANGCCADPSQGTFSYDPAMDEWTDISPPSEFSARFNYSMAPVFGTNKAIFFGGLLQNTVVGSAQQQTWEYVAAVP